MADSNDANWRALQAKNEATIKSLAPDAQRQLSEARMRIKQVALMYGPAGKLALMIEGAELIFEHRRQSKGS